MFTKKEIQMRNKRSFMASRFINNNKYNHGDLFVDLKIKKKGLGRRYWVHLKSKFNKITAIYRTNKDFNHTEWYFGGENSYFNNSVVSGFWYEKELGYGKFNCALNTRCYGKMDLINKNFRKIGVIKSTYTARKYLR